jgi:hypothetical protein
MQKSGGYYTLDFTKRAMFSEELSPIKAINSMDMTPFLFTFRGNDNVVHNKKYEIDLVNIDEIEPVEC